MTRKRRPGERAGLSRDRVLSAALELVDREGNRALTMRRLGDELGVEAMTLYHYVRTKDALLDGLVEVVVTRAFPVVDEQAPWATLLHDYATSLRRTLLRHPGVLPVVASRPAVTSATLGLAEHALRRLTTAGFPLGRALDMLNVLTVFVIGHTAAEHTVGAGTGPGSAPWLTAQDPGRYPLVVEAARSGAGTDDAGRFQFALDALLTGFVQVPS